ncbi:trypsin-like [Diachasmimorpha longicaudata]|uniref:trypsin-like n=1 Tax=Diachasmimorpha longicaudata TaxID=58733 RepID=UPI0030B88C05
MLVYILLVILSAITPGVRSLRFQLENRILGGSEASTNDFPSLVAIFRQSEQTCGGTLISPKHVLTAAHCIYEGKPYEYSILAGVTNLVDYQGIRIDVRGKMRHPNYHPPIPNFHHLKNDIGVLKLVSSIDVTAPNIAIAKLPARNLTPRTVGLTGGWGSLNKKGEKSDYLRKAVVYVWPLSHCQAKFSWHTNDQFCGSGYDVPTNMCYGDSGGPFMVGDTIFGVLSVATCTFRGTITYTKVYSHLTFLEVALKF